MKQGRQELTQHLLFREDNRDRENVKLIFVTNIFFYNIHLFFVGILLACQALCGVETLAINR